MKLVQTYKDLNTYIDRFTLPNLYSYLQNVILSIECEIISFNNKTNRR